MSQAELTSNELFCSDTAPGVRAPPASITLLGVEARDALGRRLQRFHEQPDPEHRLALFVQHIQLPFGIVYQFMGNISGQIGADAQRRPA